MINLSLLTIFVLFYGKTGLGLKVLGGIHHLASSSAVYKNIDKTWLFINEIDPEAKNIIRDELLSQLKSFKLEKSRFESSARKLEEIARDISGKILKRKKKFMFKNLSLLEDVKESSVLTEVFSFFRPNPVVYSIWNFNPNLLSKGGEFVLEIQYQFPISIKGVPQFRFSPIVTYRFQFHEGKYKKSTFSDGVIELTTHPFLPWKNYKVGTFQIYPPFIKLYYNV